VSGNTNAPWRDEATLRQKYCVEEKSLSKVGEELGCSSGTVKNWLDKFGIDTRPAPGEAERAYHDKELLRRLYVDEGLSTLEISRKLDCSKFSIQKWMKRYGIEMRKSNREKPPQFLTTEDGYEQIRHCSKSGMKYVIIHRLVAVAHGLLDPTDFTNREINIHHKNGIPWDNRPENLEPINHNKHAKHHYPERELDDKGQFVS